MPIFLPADITEDVVESVARKIPGSSGPGGMDQEALQGWLLQLGQDRKRLCTSGEIFADWLANMSPSWAEYCAFMSGHLLEIDKNPGVSLVSIG